MTQKNTIETKRLLLRTMEKKDLNDFLEYFTDPSISHFLGGYIPTEQTEISFMFLTNCKTEFTWGIELKSENKVIGDVHFGDVICDYLAHIGYVLNKDYWGNGYASEAVNAVIDYAFNSIGLGRIRAITQLCNTRSQRLLERCGFNKEALIYDGDFNGRIDDLFYYSKAKYNSN